MYINLPFFNLGCVSRKLENIFVQPLYTKISPIASAFVTSKLDNCNSLLRLWHGNEARMLFSQSILVSNYQTIMFLCFIFAKISK